MSSHSHYRFSDKKESEDSSSTRRFSVWAFWLALAIIGLMCLLSGCKSTQVPVIVERTHTEYVTRIDTTFVHDSIFHKEYIRGDTVYVYKDRWHNKYVYAHDTIARTDTIPVIKEVEVPAPYVPDYYKHCTRGFWLIVVAIVLWIGIKVLLNLYFRKL